LFVVFNDIMSLEFDGNDSRYPKEVESNKITK